MIHNPALQSAQIALDEARMALTLIVAEAERSGNDSTIRSAQERVRIARAEQDRQAQLALRM